MSRTLAILIAAAAFGVGVSAWSKLSAESREDSPAASVIESDAAAALAAALTDAKRSYLHAQVAEVVAKAHKLAIEAPADAWAWHRLAEAHLESAQQRINMRGIRVGEPAFESMPPDFAADLQAGLEAVEQAKAHGDDSASLYCVEAMLLSRQITGLISALRLTHAVNRALDSASRRDEHAAEVQFTLGIKKLLSPKLFGHDARSALEHFQQAAQDERDDRAQMFAAMAYHQLGQQEEAALWLRRAVETNPANLFAKAVLHRLQAGEAEPFGRDITPAEADAAKAR